MFNISSNINFELSNILLNIAAFLLFILSLKIIFAKNLLEMIIIMSGFSLLITLIYLLMDAPDVAMTEVALGACLSTCIYLSFLKNLPKEMHEITIIKFSSVKIIPAIVICTVFVVILTYLGFELPNYGDANSPLQAHLSKYYIENSAQDIGIPSFVAALLASYRGFDTLGETSVIFIAGISISLLFSRKKLLLQDMQESAELLQEQILKNGIKKPSLQANDSSRGNLWEDSFIRLPRRLFHNLLAMTSHATTLHLSRNDNPLIKNYPIIKNVTIFSLPFVILYSLYIQINGESTPGGGFQAGVIFASSLIGYDLIYDKTKIVFANRALIFTAGLGVLIYALTGASSLIFNDNYLSYSSFTYFTHDKLLAQHIGIFVIEIGVGICVASVMYLIYSLFKHE